MRVTVRTAVANDLPQMFAIAAAHSSAPQWTLPQFEEILSAGQSAVTRVMLVATEGTAVVGFAVASAVTAVYPVEAELESIAVAAEWHRRGVGRTLMEHVLLWAKSLDVGELRLEVRVSNIVAQKLYEAVGFKLCGMRPKYYANPVEDAVCMIHEPMAREV